MTLLICLCTISILGSNARPLRNQYQHYLELPSVDRFREYLRIDTSKEENLGAYMLYTFYFVRNNKKTSTGSASARQVKYVWAQVMSSASFCVHQTKFWHWSSEHLWQSRKNNAAQHLRLRRSTPTRLLAHSTFAQRRRGFNAYAGLTQIAFLILFQQADTTYVCHFNTTCIMQSNKKTESKSVHPFKSL